MADLTQHLPLAPTPHFTAIKGAGPAQHNLETQLHRATLSSSSGLHAIKDHVSGIAKVFDKSFVKKAIREGGLSKGEQQLVVKHIFEKNPGLSKNSLKKDIVKQIVKHFGKEQSHVSKEAMLARRREMMREDLPSDSGHATSINQMLHPKETTSAFNVTEQRQATVVKNQTFGGIGNLINSKKGLAPPSSAPKPPSLPPRLVV